MSARLAWLLWVSVWIANGLLAIFSTWLLRHDHPGLALARAIALLPALPMAAGLVLFLFILRRMDEFRRILAISTFALSSALVGIVVYGWSLLFYVGVGGLRPVWVLPAQLLLWAVLMIAARLRFP